MTRIGARRPLSVLGIGALAFTVNVVVAQTPPQVIKGKVIAIGSNDVTIETPTGKVDVGLSPDWVLFVSAPTTIGAIKPGSFIGTTNVDSPNGGNALEVHVFPPGSKFGEGDRVMDSGASMRMTNGTVQSTTPALTGAAPVAPNNQTNMKPAMRMTNGTVSTTGTGTGSGGLDLVVSFPGGKRKVHVPDTAKFTTIEPVERSTLKPGFFVSANALADPSGKLTARFMSTGPGGTPPAR